MILAQVLGGIFGLAIVWIPVRFFERREEQRLLRDLEEIRRSHKTAK
jgi:hypothetical protein